MGDLLLVDDDLDICWVLKELLELHDHDVRVAHDGLEGLNVMRQRLPEVVILDVEMPVLDGPSTAYRMFVLNTGLENIPIVLVSGFFDLAKVAIRIGTPYYLAKPFDVGELIALIERALLDRALPRPSP
jgi:DNA-binding NtrC family response regulator